MDTLVIGGTGFFGLAAVEQLLAAGHQVSIFSRGNVRPTSASTTAPGWRNGWASP